MVASFIFCCLQTKSSIHDKTPWTNRCDVIIILPHTKKVGDCNAVPNISIPKDLSELEVWID
jgi:hypothetical protein